MVFSDVVVRPSVCRLSVCRLSVTFVHRTQAIEIFGNVSTPFGTLAICDLSIKILRRSSQGNPSIGGSNRRGLAKYSDFDLLLLPIVGTAMILIPNIGHACTGENSKNTFHTEFLNVPPKFSNSETPLQLAVC